MKIGIIINTNEPETVWNAFRFGVTSLLMEHEVKVFLLGENKADEGKRGLPDLYIRQSPGVWIK